MRTARILLIVVALAVVAALFVQNYQQRNDPVMMIDAIEAGAAIPMIRLTQLGERGELDAYSDRLGELLATELEAEWKPAIANHAAKNTAALTLKDFSATSSRTETGLPANNKAQRLADIFMLSDPAKNASAQVIERVARASLHFELIRDTRVASGRDIPIGIVVYNATDAWRDDGIFGTSSELDEFLRIDRGISFGLTFDGIHLNGIPAPTRAELDFGVEMAEKLESMTSFPPSRRHSRYNTFLAATPAVESLDWPDEIDTAVVCTINLYRADDGLVASWSESISGQVSARQDMEEMAAAFERLLDDALTGDASSLDRLLALGAQGELGPFADLLGVRLAASLEAHWQPRIAQHIDEGPQSSGSLFFDDLPAETSQLLTLFFSSGPLSHASPATWEAVARAGTYWRTELSAENGNAVAQSRFFTVLAGFQDDERYQGLRTGAPRMTFGDPVLWEWTETGSTTRRVVSSSGIGGGPPGQYIPTDGSVFRVKSDEAAARFAAHGERFVPMRATIEFALLGADGQPFVSWSETDTLDIENPFMVTQPPVDEPAQDRR